MRSVISASVLFIGRFLMTRMKRYTWCLGPSGVNMHRACIGSDDGSKDGKEGEDAELHGCGDIGWLMDERGGFSRLLGSVRGSAGD